MSVYFLRNKRTGSVKIGWSENPEKRAAELRTGCEDQLDVEAVATRVPKRAEPWLHDFFRPLNLRGEWFHGFPLDVLIWLVKAGVHLDRALTYLVWFSRWAALSQENLSVLEAVSRAPLTQEILDSLGTQVEEEVPYGEIEEYFPGDWKPGPPC